jgi:hypothetical protein
MSTATTRHGRGNSGLWVGSRDTQITTIDKRKRKLFETKFTSCVTTGTFVRSLQMWSITELAEILQPRSWVQCNAFEQHRRTRGGPSHYESVLRIVLAAFSRRIDRMILYVRPFTERDERVFIKCECIIECGVATAMLHSRWLSWKRGELTRDWPNHKWSTPDLAAR